jgi:hypothetical protein
MLLGAKHKDAQFDLIRRLTLVIDVSGSYMILDVRLIIKMIQSLTPGSAVERSRLDHIVSFSFYSYRCPSRLKLGRSTSTTQAAKDSGPCKYVYDVRLRLRTKFLVQGLVQHSECEQSLEASLSSDRGIRIKQGITKQPTKIRH